MTYFYFGFKHSSLLLFLLVRFLPLLLHFGSDNVPFGKDTSWGIHKPYIPEMQHYPQQIVSNPIARHLLGNTAPLPQGPH